MAPHKNLLIIAFGASGEGISGGDRIFIEFARRWSKKITVQIAVWEEGAQMIQRQNLTPSKKILISQISMQRWSCLGFLVSYFFRIVHAVLWSFFVDISKISHIYSASEFWMDSFPAVVLKIRKPSLKWIASWYQTAPNPLVGFSYDSKDKRYRFNALIYWLMQQPVKYLIEIFADLILVNNQTEINRFKHLSETQIMVVLGAVDVDQISKYKKSKSFKKKYDAVFQGRFHPQKGVLELIDIWAKVVSKIPQAKLIMIGDGPLKESVDNKINRLKLQKNILTVGFLFDGAKKYQLFSESRLVVHPSLFDSGGMASAEAMAFDLPVIGYNLPSFKDYYSKGMQKVEIGNKAGFARAIVDLLKKTVEREKLGKIAGDYIRREWNWDQRADVTLEKILSIK